MQKFSHLFIISALLCLPSVARAQYFEVGGIAYNVLSTTERTVEVAPKSCGYYQGNINIPSSLDYNGTTYDIVALGEMAFYGATLSSVTIPQSVTRVKERCFLFASGPSSISIPASVTEIGELAFAAHHMNSILVDGDNPNYRSIGGILFSKDTSWIVACPMAKSGTITLPQNTKHLAPYAFAYCQTITKINFPDNLLSIGHSAFFGARELNNVIIPSSVSSIETNPFSGCNALNNLTIAEGNTHYFMDGIAIYSAGGDTLLSYHKSTDSVFLPNTLRVIGGFNCNKNIKYVHIPDGVTTIKDNAFGNSTLKSIVLPHHMELIDAWAFYNCTSLTQVVMPLNLDSISEGCFEGCSNLTSINIPNGLRFIPKNAFFFCESLSHITWGDAVEVIDSFAFGGCAFTELHFPVTLRSIRMGGFEAYSAGSRLNNVVFSALIDTLEPESFTYQAIGTLQFKNDVPPITTTMPTNGADYGCLYMANVDSIVIPCGSLDTWLADSYWGQFADKYIEDCDGIEDISDDRLIIRMHGLDLQIEGAEGDTVRLLDIMGRTLYTGSSSCLTLPSPGIYLLQVGHRPARKVVGW